MCLIQGGPKRKVGFCLNNLYMLRAEIKSSGSHWQTESNILMETCWVMIDRIVEREQESRSSAERWSISPINIYCTPSQQPILTVSVCVTGTAVEIPLTLYIGCWSPCGLILITSSGYSPLQEWDTDICKKFSPTCVHFFFWKQTSTHKFNPSAFARLSECVVTHVASITFRPSPSNDFSIAIKTWHWFDRFHFRSTRLMRYFQPGAKLCDHLSRWNFTAHHAKRRLIAFELNIILPVLWFTNTWS